MANATKLLNYIELNKKKLKFYTELNSDFRIGDRVFIIGGNYDNTIFTDKSNSKYDIFNKFAYGFLILDVDSTTASNAITLDIDYNDTTFNTSSNTNITSINTPYKSTLELLNTPNSLREAWITKTYFKFGEFNGGAFNGGVFGQYNINGDNPVRNWSRISDVIYTINNLKQQIDDLLNIDDYTNIDYSQIKSIQEEIDLLQYNIDNNIYNNLTSPVNNFKTKFNNRFSSYPASFNNGVVLGADYCYGTFTTKYKSNQQGKFQSLNDVNGIKSITDPRVYNITNFNNNNDNIGYSYFISGNIGRIFQGFVDLNIDNNTISISSEFPYPLNYANKYGYNTQIKIFSPQNNRILDIDYISNNIIYLKSNKSITKKDGTIQYLSNQAYDESGIFNIEIYSLPSINTQFEDVYDKESVFLEVKR
jgi:hypothetical protein